MSEPRHRVRREARMPFTAMCGAIRFVCDYDFIMQVNRTAIFDALLVLAILVGAVYGLSLLGAPVPGQIAIVLCLCVIHWRLRASGLTWADLGLRKP
jgi:hypothetical protein